ncbi:MAG: S8 family serine peptidase [Planctomycetaceae bacterium]
MTVLQSLLSTFRASRSTTVQTRRRLGRNRGTGFAVFSLESLEDRVLLSGTTPEYVPNHVILGLGDTDSPDVSQPDDIQLVIPGSAISPLGNYGLYLMTLPAGVDAVDIIPTLRGLPGVASAEPDWIGEWTAAPNDPDYAGLQWSLNNTGQTVNGVTGLAGADISAELAWDASIGSSNVMIAIVDSGMDYLHPDLIDNVWVNPGEIAGNGIDDDGNGFIDDVNGWDFADNDNDPMDFVGHGTHVSGTAGAVGDNSLGLTGVNWDVSVMALKIGTDLGGPTVAGAIGAINYAVSMGAVASNHSYTVPSTAALQNAVNFAQANGHIIVAAAGNSSSNNDIFPSFPANFANDNVISVAATDQVDDLAFFSNFGVNTVDIGAPGVNIWSTTPRAGSLFYGPNYDFSDGTSMASPHVTGAVGLLRSIAPGVSYTEIIRALYDGSDQIAALNGRVSTGGRLNLAGAIAQLSAAEIFVSPGSVSENVGAGGATITVRKVAFDIGTDLVVDVSFSDDTEVAVPLFAGATSGQITIPAGQRSVTIPVDILDDTLLDGTQTVVFTLDIAGTTIDSASLDVTDYETLTLTIDKSTLREDGADGPATATLTRSNTDVDDPNVFVTVNNELVEYDATGTIVNTVPIPWPTGMRPAGEDAHDAVFLQNGRIAVYNGTTVGYVSVYDPTAGTWQDFLVPGLSTNSLDGSGGITSIGNFVFLTDMQSAPANPFGAVRLDLVTGAVTRFATKSLGDRLFVKDIFADTIQEVNPLTGATVNTIPMPTTNTFGFNTGLAFDGTNLWLLAGPIGNDQIYKLDADTGTVLDVFNLGGATEWDGLAYLNGLLYLQDNFLQNRITVYDPVLRQIVNTLDVGARNGIDITGGLAAIRNPDALFATSTFGDEIYEINPVNGALRNTWNSGASTTEYGVAVLSGEVYIGEFQSADLRVFNRDGVFQRTVTLALTPPPGVFGLGGDDIQGLTTTNYRYRDISGGLDGKIYVLDQGGTAVGRYDATTLQLEEFFELDVPVQAITVFSDGRIYGAADDGMVHEFDGTGSLLRSMDSGITGLIDIDVNVGEKILLSSSSGIVGRTSLAFEAPTTFTAGASQTFITFGRHFTQTGGEAIVDLTNSDPSELSVPTRVIIPVGQQSVTFPVSAVDDNILDGSQSVTVSPANSQYAELNSDSVTVLDVEGVLVDVAATEISEDAGIAATTVHLSRTYIDGPFTYAVSQTFTNSQPTPIPDFAILESHIVVPSQISRISDINVQLSLTHSWLQDLDVFLVSPSGTTVELFTDVGSNGTEMTDLIIDDEALVRIIDGSSPFTGRYRPEQYPSRGMNLFDGENPSGTWTLVVRDDNQQDIGTLLNWSLHIDTVGLAPLTVTLSSDDITEAAFGGAGGPSSTIEMLIPANQSEAMVTLDAVDDQLLDGTQTVTISATAVQSPDTSIDLSILDLGSDVVDVTDVELLELSVSTDFISESAGGNALTGTVTRLNTGDAPFSSPLTVNLMSSDTSELTVLATVTIPAGEASVNFDISAVDDALFDGDIPVTISATAAGYFNSPSQIVTVTDHEPAIVLQTASTTVVENDGTLQLLVRRINALDISNPVTVTLTSSDISELSFGGSATTTVTIAANSTSTPVTVTIHDDALLDGSQVVTLDGTGAGINPGTLDITVEDHETLTITLNHSSFLENGGTGAVTGTVTVSNTGDRTLPLTVTLSSSDLTAATVPATVTIPANATSAQFTVTPINDPDIDGDQPVTFTAVAAGYIDGVANATVLDHEPPVLTGPESRTPDATPAITWDPLPGAVRYDLWVNYVSGGITQIIRVQDVRDNAGDVTTEYTPPAELGLGRYRAWVRAYNAQEVAGFWSAGRDFVVTTPPQIISPGGPGNAASPSFPDITWSDVVDITRYDLWVTNLTTGEHPIIRAENLLTSNFQTTQDLPGGDYRAWVRAFGPMDAASSWSAGRTFGVLATPQIITPSAGTSNRTPTIEWNPVSGADHYDVWITNRDTGAIVVRDRFVPEATYKPLSDLSDQRHVVWVRAVSEMGFVSQWSPAANFVVSGNPELGRPVVTSPSQNGVAGSRPEFAWTPIAGVDGYEIWVNRVDVPTRQVIYSDAVTTNSYTATTALAAGEYRVWVRALSDSGEVSEWSAAVDFTVAAASVPVFDAGATPSPVAILTGLTEVSVAQQSDAPAIVPNVAAPASDSHATKIADDAASVKTAEFPQPETRAAAVSPTAVVLDRSEEAPAEDFDAVMANWDSAAWWTEPAQETPGHEASLAGLGLAIVAGGSLNRKRRPIRNRD